MRETETWEIEPPGNYGNVELFDIVVELVDDPRKIMLTRDGKPWAVIIPIEEEGRG